MLTPVFRLEYFITAAANGTPCDLEPIFNEEKYLHAIAGASVDLPMPIGRTQEYLAKLAGMDVEIPDKPIYRTEYYLAHMIDNTVECPAPIFREEMFYYEWASNEYVTISGNPVSFTAKAAPLRKLKVAFSPVQDLHGYDAPWPAGGGANKMPPLVAGTYTGDGATIEVDNDGHAKVTRTAGIKGGILIPFTTPFVAEEGMFFHQNSVGDELLYDVIGLKDENGSIYNLGYPGYSGDKNKAIPASAVGKTITALRYYINTESKVGVCTLRPSIDYTSTAPTAWTPYENICPISGWSSLTVEQAGVNLLDRSKETDGYRLNTTGGLQKSDNAATSDYIISFPNTSYYFKNLIGSSSGTAICEYDRNKVFLRRVTIYGSGAQSGVKTTGDDTAYIRVSYYNGSDYDRGVYYPSTVRDYAPYNGRSISISLGQTVYSGWVDVVTGVVTVDRAGVDMGSMTWAYSSADKRFYNNNQPVKPHSQSSVVPPLLSSSFKAVSLSEFVSTLTVDGTMSMVGNYIFVRDLAYTDAADFKAAVTGQTLVYELATPLTIQLTPQEVQSLAGDNVLFSDANGDLTVTYRSN